MKYCVIFFASLISVGCSTSLHERDIRECRENAFQNKTLPIAVIETQYKDCLSKKKEMQVANKQMAVTDNVLEIVLTIFGVKKPD